MRLWNIRFFRDGRELSHNNHELEYVDSFSITFEWQKKDERMDTVTQVLSGDRLLCPVRQWAAVVRRIWGYPGATREIKVSAVWKNYQIEHITSKEINKVLEEGVASIGYEVLGIRQGELGSYSVRLGVAMAMYLGECPVYSIMMIGRWSSDAFLRYIQKQVEQFSHNISRRMLQFQFFRHIPEHNSRVSHLDASQNNSNKHVETKNVGEEAQEAQLPAFSLFH